MFIELTKIHRDDIKTLLESRDTFYLSEPTADYKNNMVETELEFFDNKNINGMRYYGDENVNVILIAVPYIGTESWGLRYVATRKGVVFEKTYGLKSSDIVYDIINFVIQQMANENYNAIVILEPTSPTWEKLLSNQHMLSRDFIGVQLREVLIGESLPPAQHIDRLLGINTLNLYSENVLSTMRLVEYSLVPQVQLAGLPRPIFPANFLAPKPIVKFPTKNSPGPMSPNPIPDPSGEQLY